MPSSFTRILLAGLAAGLVAGCSSSPNYAEVPTAKLPAGAVPTQPPPPPPAGAQTSGPPPDYAGSVAPAAPSSPNPPAGGSPSSSG